MWCTKALELTHQEVSLIATSEFQKKKALIDRTFLKLIIVQKAFTIKAQSLHIQPHRDMP
jgi:hypothetical protein